MRKPIVATATALTVVATGLAVAGVSLTARPERRAQRCPRGLLCLHYGVPRRRATSDLCLLCQEDHHRGLCLRHTRLGAVGASEHGGAGGDTQFRSREYAAHPTNGWLYKVVRHGEVVDGTWRITSISVSQHTNGFAGTRILAYGYPYLYRVAGNSLYRYTISSSTGELTARVKLPGTAWNTVNTLTFERSGRTGSAAVDVLIGTKSNGELKEWRINRATPTQITSKVLKTSGWAAFSTLSTGPCSAHPNGRALVGITDTGRVSVYFDAKATDGVGTDIQGGSLGELDWTAKSYGQ